MERPGEVRVHEGEVKWVGIMSWKLRWEGPCAEFVWLRWASSSWKMCWNAKTGCALAGSHRKIDRNGARSLRVLTLACGAKKQGACFREQEAK
eukprot:6182643-Pleurochrysis_carterae.AAC.1